MTRLSQPPGESVTRPYCDGDGTSGKRVQIMYVRATDRPARYSEYLESIRAWSAEMDEIFDISAQATRGRRRIRFVTDDKCQVDVLTVVVPAAADDTLRATIKALRTIGYNSADRKYVMFVDANVYCGIATAINDSSASPENRNNRQAGFARVDSGCWNGANAAHELVHLLGGVQQNAPNASGGWHCTDEFDLMCYSDTPNYPTMRYLCPLSREELLDCNHDDYFHSNPAPGSYLATHWNVANSAFLLTPEDIPNATPYVRLYTVSGTHIFTAPATIQIAVDVVGQDDTLGAYAAAAPQLVEFYNATTLLATVTTVPYEFTWSDVAAGVYTLTARFYDAQSLSAVSNPLHITVLSAGDGPAGGQGVPEPTIQAQIFLPLVMR